MFTAVLIGAGDRGKDRYGAWALHNGHKIKFVAVAEPLEVRRKKFAKAHGIAPENCFKSWDELFAQGKVADVCFVTTQDRQHTEPAIKAFELGYHVMLEKPISTSADECRQIIAAAKKADRQLRIAHVLRYTPFFQQIKKAVDNGLIGQVMNISHSENISYWHFAHSYVRGKWRRADEGSPLILAKTCHDLDIIYWLAGAPARKVSSFGRLRFYKPENAPDGSPERCLNGCPVSSSCQWYAPRIYLTTEPMLQTGLRSRYKYKSLMAKTAIKRPLIIKSMALFYSPLKTLANWDNWPVSTITDNPADKKSKKKALEEGPYGRCVFHCDNDVCDNQVVNMEFENGVTATLTVHGFASFEGRWLRLEGTKGTILAKFTAEHQEIIVYDHYNVEKNILMDEDLDLSGHMGGDDGIMKDLVASLQRDACSETKDKGSGTVYDNGMINSSPEVNQDKEDNIILTSGEVSLESHLMAFAAEESRLKGRIVEMDKIRK